MNTSVFGQVEPVVEERFDAPLPSVEEEDIELVAGTCIHGKYIVHGVLGHGGFAVVYDAEHMGLGRRVAIKVLHIRHDTPLALVERFRREARISALVRHPNVLEVYDTGSLADGSPYLVMERVNGENVAALIRRGPLPIAAAIELGCQLLLGLAAIADEGIVHRDIKPDNLMLHDAGDGTPSIKLVDFGISKRVSIEPQSRLTCHGALVGTPQYMSPEQIRGEEVDIRTDIYATGAVLYEVLCGHAPHESQSFSELVVAVLNAAPRPLTELRKNCPVELQRIVLKALSRSPAQRYATPRQMLEALDEFATLFDLPRGATAFSAADREEPYVLSAARSSWVSVRRLWGFRLGDVRRPLQLTLVALLLGTPGVAIKVQDALQSKPQPNELVARAKHEPRASEGTLQSTGSGTVDALFERMVDSPLAAAPVRAYVDTEAELANVSPDAVVAGKEAPVRRTMATVQGRAQARAAKAPGPSGTTQARASLQPARAEPPAPPVIEQARSERFEQTMRSALAALVRGQLEQAQRHYKEAARIAPNEATAFRGLGLVSARLGTRDQARTALRRYLTLSPHAPDAAAIEARIKGLD